MKNSLWHGYERIGSELSPLHLRTSIDITAPLRSYSIELSLPVNTEARKVRKTAAELRYSGGKSQQEALDRFGIKRPLRCLLFPGRTHTAMAANWFGKTGPEPSGLYRMRLQASGIRPNGGQPAHLSIGNNPEKIRSQAFSSSTSPRPKISPKYTSSMSFWRCQLS